MWKPPRELQVGGSGLSLLVDSELSHPPAVVHSCAVNIRGGVVVVIAAATCGALLAAPGWSVPEGSSAEEDVITAVAMQTPFTVVVAAQQVESHFEEIARIRSEVDAYWNAAASWGLVASRASEDASGLQEQLDDSVRFAWINGSPTTSQLIIQSSRENSISDALQGIAHHQFAMAAASDETVNALVTAQRVTETHELMVARATTAVNALDQAKQSLVNAQDELRRVAAAAGPEMLTAVSALASTDTEGCPTSVPQGANENAVDVNALCRAAVADASTPAIAAALSWAFRRLGSPYACQGVGRENPFQFDCSSYVARAFTETASGLTPRWSGTHTATTHDMLNENSLSTEHIATGDFVLYDTCPVIKKGPRKGERRKCDYNHVGMFIKDSGGAPWMLHTGVCEGVANITPFWGFTDSDKGDFLGVRRPR